MLFSPSDGDFMNEMKFLENKEKEKKNKVKYCEVKDSCSRIRGNKKTPFN